MTRAQLIECIDGLSDDDIDRIGPALQADIASFQEIESLHREIELGRASAREEPLLDHATVMSGALALLSARP